MNERNKSIALIVPAIVMNNAFGSKRALEEAGYSKSFIPDGEMEAKLFQLYLANPEKFFELLNSIPWLENETQTNRPEIKQRLIALSGIQNTPATRGEWWKKIVQMIQTQ